jgi:hypothetical protein
VAAEAAARLIGQRHMLIPVAAVVNAVVPAVVPAVVTAAAALAVKWLVGQWHVQWHVPVVASCSPVTPAEVAKYSRLHCRSAATLRWDSAVTESLYPRAPLTAAPLPLQGYDLLQKHGLHVHRHLLSHPTAHPLAQRCDERRVQARRYEQVFEIQSCQRMRELELCRYKLKVCRYER